MNDIEELSKRLFESDYFVKGLKERIQQFSKQKTDPINQQLFRRLQTQASSAQITDRFMPLTQEPPLLQERPSITSSAFEKRESCESISSINSSPIFKQYLQTYSLSQEYAINELTKEVASCLGEMVKRECEVLSWRGEVGTGSLGIDNERLYELIENMREIQKYQLQSVQQSFTQKMQTFKSQITTKIQRLKQELKIEKMHQKSALIKKQHKKVTQSILEFSKSNQQLSTFSNLQDIENILSESNNSDDREQETSIRRKRHNQHNDHHQNNSPNQLSQLSSKIMQVENSQIKISKQFQQKFLKQVQQNKSDIQQLTDKIIQWKLKNEERLQDGFTGVWNIVTDIQDKLNKLTLRVCQIEHIMRDG